MCIADSHPEAEVIGVDLSPIQPNFVPPNLQFQIDDIEKEWTFSRNFDFIFSRMMTGAITDWKTYIQNCFDHTEPGGYLEVQDICYPPRYIDESGKGTSIEKWAANMIDGASKLGVAIDSAKGVKKIMEDIGYLDVVETVYQWPMNTWPADKKMKEIGLWAHHAGISNLDGLSMVIYTHGLGWSPEAVTLFLADVRKDMKNSKIHAYWPM
ncbi:Secondary metabolism regulator [Lachnellula occidentalis]|uniref:Secondary metabolism regulator n=1 Tax=Lachnellula occidentalis TaxID=215460 RepID=A0A8H8RU71_9HELO|nr:Secondary metabolism regulator [Lachnellula occidentalis]